MEMTKERVVVVGGGVIGICCSYFLAKRGLRVTLIERNGIGSGASFGNAGSVAVGHTPINKPGRVLEAAREMLNPRSPFRIPLRWNPGLIKWLWKYRSHCNKESFDIIGRLPQRCTVSDRSSEETTIMIGSLNVGVWVFFRDMKLVHILLKRKHK